MGHDAVDAGVNIDVKNGGDITYIVYYHHGADRSERSVSAAEYEALVKGADPAQILGPWYLQQPAPFQDEFERLMRALNL